MIKKTFFYLCFISSIAFFYVTCSDVQSTQTYVGKVIKVIDGDTIDVDIDGKVERLRLIGIDTPETVDPRKGQECFGEEASNKTKKLLSLLSSDRIYIFNYAYTK